MKALGYDTGSVRPPIAFKARRSTRFAALRARHYLRRYTTSRNRGD